MAEHPDLDTIIARVREEAHRPEYQVVEHEPLAPLQGVSPSGGTSGSANRDSALAPLPTSMNDFFCIEHPSDFIQAVYRRFVGRDADGAGASYYGDKLAAGYGRPFVIAALAASPESIGARIQGMGLAPWVYNLWRVARRIGLEPVGRWCNAAYGKWRQLRAVTSEHWLENAAQAKHGVQEELAAYLNAAEQHSQRLSQSLEAVENTTQERLSGVQSRLAEVQSQLDTLSEQDRLAGELMQSADKEKSEQLAAVQRDLAILRASFRARRLTAAGTSTGSTAVDQSTPAASAARADSDSVAAEIDAYYFAFEETHRGSEQVIRSGLSPYLTQLGTLAESVAPLPALDLGCGRGEWLSLLRENGFSARGADTSPIMAAHCQEHGLNVQLLDALTALRSCDDNSLSVLSAFHLIEHLPFTVLFELLDEASRVLAPGGLLLLETPNPENVLVGSHTFYHDFSHRNPITPSALDFLVGYLGFEERQLLRLSPYPAGARVEENSLAAERINGHFCGPQDLGMIARKPLVDATADAPAPERETSTLTEAHGEGQAPPAADR